MFAFYLLTQLLLNKLGVLNGLSEPQSLTYYKLRVRNFGGHFFEPIPPLQKFLNTEKAIFIKIIFLDLLQFKI